jgi:hypothetical protein
MDSAIGTATGCGLEYKKVWSSSLGRVKNFLFSPSFRLVLGLGQASSQ